MGGGEGHSELTVTVVDLYGVLMTCQAVIGTFHIFTHEAAITYPKLQVNILRHGKTKELACGTQLTSGHRLLSLLCL